MKRAGRVLGVFLAAALATDADAGGPLDGSTQHILPSAQTHGGSGDPNSASHRLIDAIGESGQKELSSAGYFLYPGFGNLVAWPETILGLTATPGASLAEIRLDWTAPKADGDVGTAAAYDIRYSQDPAEAPGLSEAKFQAAASVADFVAIPAPGAPGASEQLVVPGLNCNPYYFAIKAKGAWHGWSHLGGGTNEYALHDRGAILSMQDIDVGDVNVGSELVVPTAVTITNPGDCPTTLSIKAEPTTPGTPWTIAASRSLDAFTVQAAMNSTLPASGDFEDADKLTTVYQASTPSKFALDQTGVSVGGGANRKMWVKVGMPTITSTVDTQTIQLTVFGAPP